MDRELEGNARRRIRVHTRFGFVEGELATNEAVSTLHFLNVVSATCDYLPVQPPLVTSREWFLDDSPLEVALDSVLFIAELSDFEPDDGDSEAASMYQPTLVRLRVREYTIDGQVYVPPGGTAIDRLSHSRHSFVALTSASVVGPDAEFSAGFIALNRTHVCGVQQDITRDADPAMVVEDGFARS